MNTDVLYHNAELSLAAYANFNGSLAINHPDNLDALEAADMTQTQAEQFTIRWPKIVEQYIDTVTGFSATVFRNGSDVNIAIRGTEGVTDLLADLQLGVGQTPFQYEALKEFYSSLKLSGAIQTTDNLTISGHSLGGFLAQLLAIDYAGDFDHTYTFNAPGIGGVPLDLFGISDNTFSAGITNVRGGGFSAVANVGTSLGNVEEIQIENSLFIPANHSIEKLTDSLSVFNTLSQIDTNLTVEEYNDVFSASSHIESATLESIVNVVGKLLQAGSNVIDDDREGLHSRLKAINTELYTDPDIANPQLKNQHQNLRIVDVSTLSDAALSNTADGYAYRYALNSLMPFAVTGTSALYSQHNFNGDLNAENFSDQYLNDRAELLCFMLTRNTLDITQTDITSIGANPNYFVQDKESQLLLHGVNVPGGIASPDTKRIIFGSNESETEINGADNQDKLYGMAGDDTIHGGAGSDTIEGNADNDELYGDDDRDYLYGGKGIDKLYGGKGEDVLSGGSGDFADTYFYNSGDGRDTIIDADIGGDRIVVNGVDLATLEFKAVFGINDTYLANGDDEDPYNDIAFINKTGEGIISIAGPSNTAGSISLLSFDKQANDFGITLNDSGNLVLPAITGNQFESVNHNLWDYANDPVSYFHFNGTANNDEIIGGYRGDRLAGFEGDDYLEGGGNRIIANSIEFERDILRGGLGSDVIYGGDSSGNVGDASDWLWSNTHVKYKISGNWVLGDVVANTLDTLYVEEDPLSKEFINGGLGDDVISGDSGQDTLLGGGGEDLAASGKGADFVDGGAGPDFLLGDSRLEIRSELFAGNQYRDVVVLDPIFTSDINRTYDDLLFGGAGNDDIHGELGEDSIFGGDGNDFLQGDRYSLLNTENTLRLANSPIANAEEFVQLDGQYHGDDQIYGEAGDDEIAGNGGSDFLSGGLGDDVIFGDDSGLNDAVDLIYHGKDQLKGGEGNDILFGGGDNDWLEGGVGNDYIDGDLSTQGIVASAENGELNNVLNPLFHGDDVIDGGEGNDFILGGAGDDQIQGGEGDDEIYGDSQYDLNPLPTNPSFSETFHGSDTVHGGAGADVIYAGAGNDRVFGDAGADSLWGQGGDDLLFGGKGDDWLAGGNGNDKYIFNQGDGSDTLEDTSGSITLAFNSSSMLDDLSITQDTQTTSISYGAGDLVVMDNATFNHVTHIQLSNATIIDRFQFIDKLNSNAVNSESTLTVQTQNPESNINVELQGVNDDLIIHVSEEGSTQKSFSLGSGVPGQILFTDIEGNLSTPDLASSLILKNWWTLTQNQRVSSVVVDEVTQPIQEYSIPRSIFGGAGDDNIYSGDGDDELHGGDGNDVISSADGADKIYGDRGNDRLLGGQGIDEYWFSAGDGKDVIGNSSSSGTTTMDIIKFDESVNPTDVILSVDLVDLLIDYNGGSDQIRVDAYFADDIFQFDKIQFADGTIWDESTIRGVTGIAETDLWFQGFANNYAYGESPEDFNYVVTNENDGAITYLDGGVFGNMGDQVIVSGSASKTPNVEYFNSGRLDGFLGNDTIYAGGGDDEVVGGPSSFADGYHYEFDSYGGYFYSLPYGMSFHNLKGLHLPFPEGNPDDGDNLLFAEGGNDLVRSGSGADVLDGGHGDDKLYGSFNEDTYIFDRGYGQDLIRDSYNASDVSPLDVIAFGEGIGPDDVIVQQINIAAYYDAQTSTSYESREEVRFAIKNTQDSISINVKGSTLSSELLEVRFANGDSWSSGDIQTRIENDELYTDSVVNTIISNEITGTSASERLEAGSEDETLNGLAGNDGLYGFEGNDLLNGGAGDDQLAGGSGNDVLEGGTGNDYLIGGNDNDTYVFSPGFGTDILDNYDDSVTDTNQIGGISMDSIQFQAGIASLDISLSRSGDDLLVNHAADQVTVKNHFLGEDLGFNERYAIDEIRFEDEPSTIWNKSDIQSMLDENVDSSGFPGRLGGRQFGLMRSRLRGRNRASRFQTAALNDRLSNHPRVNADWFPALASGHENAVYRDNVLFENRLLQLVNNIAAFNANSSFSQSDLFNRGFSEFRNGVLAAPQNAGIYRQFEPNNNLSLG